MADRDVPCETSKMMVEEKIEYKENKSAVLSKGRILLIVLAVISFIVLIVGIVLIALAVKKKDCDGNEDEHRGSSGGEAASSAGFCEYSVEAKRIGLDDIIRRVKNSFYKHHSFQLPSDPDAKRDEIKDKYTAYNPTPEYIKQVTDAAWDLLKEINQTKLDSDKLKPRERKALSQLKHYLKTVFGQPFDMNYYTGHWMMGPTFFCNRQSACSVIRNHVHNMLKSLKPENLEDVNLLETKLKTHKEGILRYMENLKLGKFYGMVYNQEACVGSRDAIKRFYLQIALNNETGQFQLYIFRNVCIRGKIYFQM